MEQSKKSKTFDKNRIYPQKVSTSSIQLEEDDPCVRKTETEKETRKYFTPGLDPR